MAKYENGRGFAPAVSCFGELRFPLVTEDVADQMLAATARTIIVDAVASSILDELADMLVPREFARYLP